MSSINEPLAAVPVIGRYRSLVNPAFDRADGAFSPYILYNYVPNRGFNIFAAIVWGLVFLAHLYWLFAARRRTAESGFVTKKRTRSIQALFALGSALEFIVYILRSVNRTRPFQARLFSAQYTINTFAPLFFVMAMQLGLLKALAHPREHHVFAFNQPKTILHSLIGLSAIALLLNLIGSALWSSMNHRLLRGDDWSVSPNTARNVLTAGQAIEIASITLTLALLTWVLLKFFQNRTRNVYFLNRIFLALLYLTLGMLFTRAIYRLVETRQGWWGRAWSSEALFGVFDFATTWTAVTIWAAWPMRNALDSVRDDHFVSNNKMSHDTTYTGNTVAPAGVTTTTTGTTTTGPATTGTAAPYGTRGATAV